MRKLQVKAMGTDVQGVEIRGDKHTNPEPIHFRVTLPFGDVDIARTSDDEYWIHVHVNRPEYGHYVAGETKLGRIVDARIDAYGKHAGEIPDEVLGDPKLCHLAVRLAPEDAR